MSRVLASSSAFAALIASTCLGAPAARAHAMLDHASPRVGSVVAAPSEVRLWFTLALEPRLSRAELRSPAGTVIATGAVERADPRQLAIRARGLAPGKYKVIWKVMSVDSHATQGDFSFEVAR